LPAADTRCGDDPSIEARAAAIAPRIDEAHHRALAAFLIMTAANLIELQSARRPGAIFKTRPSFTRRSPI
jgi:hypothetical protein